MIPKMNTTKPKMTYQTILIITALAGIGGCATLAPDELVKARSDYEYARAGISGNAAPAEVHVASEALALAELSFEAHGDTYRTRDLAYVAQRKSAMAEATAAILTHEADEAKANQEFQDTQGEIIAGQDKDLALSGTALAASRRTGQRTAEELAQEKRAREAADQQAAKELAAEKSAREAADQRAADAQTALATLAAVKSEPRGMVITLSGSVMFASNKSTLKSTARARLERVADVLLTNGDRKIVVEGHTDSQGSSTDNLFLSRSRADAVRDTLVRRGYKSTLIEARGMGEGNPIADNTSTEGRANNRRVEIIVEQSQ